MRITQALFTESYRWRFKQLWKYGSKAKYYEPHLVQSLFLKSEEVPVVKAADVVAPKPIFERWVPPVPDDIQFGPPPSIKNHPDYREDAVYEFSTKSQLIEGENQALILTKSQPFYTLPSNIQNLVGRLELPDQDKLMQRIIMQANVWDPTKEKLPRRHDPNMLGWKFKVEFGIPNYRIATVTTRNVLRLCEMLGGWHSNLLNSRRTSFETFLSTYYYFQDNKPILITGLQDALVYAKTPLDPFAHENVIDDSVSYNVPNIFPLAPTIDLKNQHVWRDENTLGYKPGFSFPFPHTLFLCYDDNWTTSQRNARALMLCFGHALAYAKQQYGENVKTLPQPISTQCIMTNGSIFSFVCFQLNTVDLSKSSGIKNLVWFDNDNAMFNKILPKRAMLRNTKYEDYDPVVLQKIFAFYGNGAKLSSKS